MVINVSIVVDENLNKLGHEDLLLTEGSRKGGDVGGIPSLHRDSCRVFRLVEYLTCPKTNAECAHEVGCSVDSATSPINYRSCSFCVTGERSYGSEELLNVTDICENLTRHLNGREHYHSDLTMFVPGEEGEEVRVVLKLYHLEHEGIKGYVEQLTKIINIGLIEGSVCAFNGQHRGLSVYGVGFLSCGRNSSVSVLPLKGCGTYAKTAADVVHPAGLSA